jgi:DNA primase
MAGVDFAAVRDAVSMTTVLTLLKFAPPERNGQQLRGPCPIHRSQSTRSRSLSVNVEKNAFRCFGCGAAGNQLELWAKVHGLNLFDAALDLCERADVPVPRIGAASTAAETDKRNP